MFKKTGPGKGATNPNPAYFDFLLYNFDVEGTNLKPEHPKYLDDYIVPKILAGWTFVIQGTASRTGSNRFDYLLSQLRANAVTHYLEEKLQRSLTRASVEAIGKDSPIGKLQEDDLDRGVRLYGWNQPVPPPPPKPRPQWKPAPMPEIGPPITPATSGPTIEFFIKMTAGISVGPKIVQGEYQRFLIWDKIHGKAAYFDRKAIGVGIPSPLPGGFTREGEFNRIVLHRPMPAMRLEEFDGAASFLSGRGTGDTGTTRFTIKPFGVGDSREIVIDPFRTGFTFGFSFEDGTLGVLSMDKDRGVFERKD